MTVDFTFAEQNVTFEIDDSQIVFNPDQGGGEEPGGGDEPGGDENNIKVTGLPAEYTNPDKSGTPVVVNFEVPAGFKNLFVTIRSTNEEFVRAITTLGLNETFDLCNPGDLEPILGEGDGIDEGLHLLPVDGELTGMKQFEFNVTGFMTMLRLFGASEDYFDIKAVDANDKVVEGTLTVHMTE